jgi:hypothetical protein
MLTEAHNGTTVIRTLNNSQRRNTLAMPLRESPIADGFDQTRTASASRRACCS